LDLICLQYDLLALSSSKPIPDRFFPHVSFICASTLVSGDRAAVQSPQGLRWRSHRPHKHSLVRALLHARKQVNDSGVGIVSGKVDANGIQVKKGGCSWQAREGAMLWMLE
jgi:hypothetical protein